MRFKNFKKKTYPYHFGIFGQKINEWYCNDKCLCIDFLSKNEVDARIWDF
jgi:hypothetical protein